MLKRFVFYLLRWQLSTPILWPIVKLLGVGLRSIVLANLIGGSIFFWVDRFIFTSPVLEVWHFRERGICDRCGRETSVWRLVKTRNYDKTDSKPIFLCSKCSKEKLKELRSKGIKTSEEPQK